MKKYWQHARSRRAYIQVRNRRLAVLVNASAGMEFSSHSLIESSRDGLVSRLRVLKQQGITDIVLVFPREEILAQDFEVPVGSESLQKVLYDKLERFFPCSVDELSYGVRWAGGTDALAKGTLVATTNNKLNSLIEPIESAGLSVTDVISTDEAALSFFAPKLGGARKMLLINCMDDSVECMLVKEGSIQVSRVFRADEENLMQDIGLTAMDIEDYEKILVSGSPDPKFLEALRAQFHTVTELIPAPADRFNKEIPTPLYGALSYGTRKFVSLLTAEKKIARKIIEQKKERLRACLAALGCIFSLVLFFSSHQMALAWKLGSVESKIAKMGPESVEIKKMSDQLALAAARSHGNQAVLRTLREIFAKTPSTVTISKLTIENSKLVIQGQSHDNAGVADAVSVLKSISGASGPKLDYSSQKIILQGAVQEFSISADLDL
jgi:hypothetical protein